MSKYELVIVVDAHLTQDQKNAIFKQTEDIVTKSGGKVTSNKLWIERHRPDFKIKKCSEMSYNLIEFESAQFNIPKINPLLRLNEDILRFLIIKTNN